MANIIDKSNVNIDIESDAINIDTINIPIIKGEKGDTGTTDFNELQNKPTKLSDFENDSEFIDKSVNNLENYTKTNDLSSVATSGSYNDLLNKPSIPSKTSDLNNDSGFITKDVNNLTNYTLKTNTGSLIDLEINQSTYVVTLTLKDIDGNVISTDTIDLPLESVVVGGSYDAINKKIVLTLENGNTVDIPVGDLIAGLQTEITSQNKLASDLVDDSNSGNKFVNTSEKNSWNAKYDKPNGGIPKTDLASAVQTSLDKADTAVQDVSDKEDVSNKVTEIDENSTDTEYPSAKLLYDELAEKQEQIDGLVTENALLKDQIPNGTAEGTNVQITDSSNLPIEDGVIKGNTSQVQYTGKNFANIHVITNLSNQFLSRQIVGETIVLSDNTNSSGFLTTEKKLSQICPNLKVDDEVKLSFNTTTTTSQHTNGIYLAGVNQLWYINGVKTITQEMLDSMVVLYGGYNETAVISNFMIRLASITDETYEPYTGGQPSPNPDYKQDIHTVTGDCEVEVENENLFNPANIIEQRNCSIENDKITITDNSGWGQARIFCGEKLYAGQYTFSIYGNSSTVNLFVRGYKNGEIYEKLISGFYIYNTYYKASNHGNFSTVSDKKSFTLPNDCDYYYVGFGLGRNGTETVTVKVEKGTNDNPTYTPHAHQTFPIGLTGKNLFDVNSITSGYELDGNTGNLKENSNYYTSDYIEVKPNTSYFISSSIKNAGSSNWFYDKNKTPLVKVTQIKGEVIVPNNAQIKYIRFNGALAQLQNLMFILGHEDAPYVPYRPPIELCKIGDYQDYLFKNVRTLRSGRANPLFNADLDEGAWYKYSAIGKVVLDGSEGSWNSWYNTGNNNIAFYNYLNGVIAKNNSEDIINGKAYCNMFSEAPTREEIVNGVAEKFKICGRWEISYLAISLSKDKLSNWSSVANAINSFKSWLASNNPIVYYILATPTYTKITDTTLIAQLEAYYNSSTYRNVTNIITAGEDLPPIASIVYKKDLTTLFNKLDSLEARVDLLE